MKGFLGLGKGRDLGIDPGLAHAARDELGDLAAEIDDQDGVGEVFWLHGGPVKASVPLLSSIRTCLH